MHPRESAVRVWIRGRGRGQEGSAFPLSVAPVFPPFFVAPASLCCFAGTPSTSAFSFPSPVLSSPSPVKGFINNFRLTTLEFQFLSLRNDIMVLLSREDIFSSRENLSLHEEELDVNRLDYYQVSDNML